MQKTQLQFRTPANLITVTNQYRFDCGWLCMKNQGTSTIEIDMIWTLLPGESVFFPAGMAGDLNVLVNTHAYNIKFGDGVNKLAVIMQIYDFSRVING